MPLTTGLIPWPGVTLMVTFPVTFQEARKAARTSPAPAAEAPKTLASQRVFPKTYDPNYVFQDDPDSADNPPPPPPETDRAATNRANAQKSTGPVTPEGKAISALNALKHGLTGNTILLATDDADAYQHRLDEYVAQYKPVTLEERRFVQSLHDAAWRLDRIVNLESTLYAKGLIELHMCFYTLPKNSVKASLTWKSLTVTLNSCATCTCTKHAPSASAPKILPPPERNP